MGPATAGLVVLEYMYYLRIPITYYTLFMPRHLQIALAGLLLVGSVQSAQAQPPPVSLSFSSPTSNQPVDSAFTVTVYCASQTSYAITSVVATLQGRSTVLTSSAQWYYSGVVSLVGLAYDSAYTLTVVGKNANGDSTVISEPVIFDPPPMLTVIQPVWGAVGRPTIDVKANCVSPAGHCQITVQIVDGTNHAPPLTFTDSVTTTIDVSAYEGSGNLQVQIVGTDQFNVQSKTLGGNIYAETSPYLTPIYTANNPITGFLGNTILVQNLLSTNRDSPRIVNYLTGAVSSVPFKGVIPYSNGEFISSRGMVFLGQPANAAGGPAGQQALYDWNSGTLDSLPDLFPAYVHVYGGYAAYMAGGPQGLFLRNLTTQTTQLVDTRMDNVYDLDSSGVLAYSNNNGLSSDSLLLYKNGVSTAISIQPSGTLVSEPLTDGKNVVYIQQNNINSQFIYRYDAKSGTNTLLTSLQNPLNLPKPIDGTAYRVSNGYTAFLQPDRNSIYQAWVRDTAGINTQASFFSTPSSLERLAPNGELAFLINGVTGFPNGLRQIYDKTAGLVPISSPLGVSYFQDSSWYLTIGNTLFRVNLHISPDKADSFAVNVKEDSLYTFSVNDFASHYHSSGSLMSVVLTKVPAHGTLRLNGVSVTINQVIPRSSLVKLVYTPVLGFSGSDTAAWTGSNGFMSSADTALLVFNVALVFATAPPAPQLSGLPATYCGNDGSTEKVMITNIPGPINGVTVSANLDGQPLLVPAQGYVSIQPWKMSTGSHTLVVIFTNSLGADTTSAVFQIVAPSTPVVTLAATPSTLTSTTEEVLLTATDVSGGGTRPQYTFSTDFPNNTHILQAESDSNTMTVAVSSLTADTTVIYVLMTTSDSCITSPVSVDSVVLIIPAGTKSPPADTTGTNGIVGAGPNPFIGQLVVNGLDPTKGYGISVVNASGQVVLSRAVQGQKSATLNTGGLGRAMYYLKVYDAQTGRVISSKVLLKVE